MKFTNSLKFSGGDTAAAAPPAKGCDERPIDPEASRCWGVVQERAAERIEPCLRDLQQIAARQDALLRIVATANLRFAEHPDWLYVQAVMAQAPKYAVKVKQLRAQMQSLSQRSRKLTQRTAHLQERKERADERERELTAKPAPGVLAENNKKDEK